LEEANRKAKWRRGLAELLIIVLGVLIALWVDNWNGEREDRLLEQEYLSTLATDLRADLVELDEASERARLNERAAQALYDAIQGTGSLAPDSLSRFVLQAGFLYFPAYSPYTFEDLTSTGNLRLLRSEEIRRALAAYHNEIGVFGQWSERYRWIQRDYTESTRGVLGPDLVRQAEDPEAVDGGEASSDDSARILAELRNREGVLGALEQMIWVQVRQLSVHQSIRRSATELLALVERP